MTKENKVKLLHIDANFQAVEKALMMMKADTPLRIDGETIEYKLKFEIRMFHALLTIWITQPSKDGVAIEVNDKDPMDVFPTMERLVEITGWSEPTVKKAIDQLCEVGLITKRKATRTRNNIYKIKTLQDSHIFFDLIDKKTMDYHKGFQTYMKMMGQELEKRDMSILVMGILDKLGIDSDTVTETDLDNLDKLIQEHQDYEIYYEISQLNKKTIPELIESIEKRKQKDRDGKDYFNYGNEKQWKTGGEKHQAKQTKKIPVR